MFTFICLGHRSIGFNSIVLADITHAQQLATQACKYSIPVRADTLYKSSTENNMDDWLTEMI